MKVDVIFSKYEGPSAVMGRILRRFLLEYLPGIAEQPDPRANLIGYSYGSGYKDMICTILMSKKGVKLGFYKGGELPDPHQLLAGRGKVHRYVQINTEQDLDNPALLGLLKDAVQARRARMSGK